MDSLQRKGINFDLNTQALKEYYPKGDWHNAYADVRDFFEANGFEHIQGSGYHSVEAMSEAKAMAVIYQMTKEFPWLNYCVNVPYQMYRNCLISRMYLPEKRNGWKRKMHDLTNYFQYVIFISSKKGSS